MRLQYLIHVGERFIDTQPINVTRITGRRVIIPQLSVTVQKSQSAPHIELEFYCEVHFRQLEHNINKMSRPSGAVLQMGGFLLMPHILDCLDSNQSSQWDQSLICIA